MKVKSHGNESVQSPPSSSIAPPVRQICFAHSCSDYLPPASFLHFPFPEGVFFSFFRHTNSAPTSLNVWCLKWASMLLAPIPPRLFLCLMSDCILLTMRDFDKAKLWGDEWALPPHANSTLLRQLSRAAQLLPHCGSVDFQAAAFWCGRKLELGSKGRNLDGPTSCQALSVNFIFFLFKAIKGRAVSTQTCLHFHIRRFLFCRIIDKQPCIFKVASNFSKWKCSCAHGSLVPRSRSSKRGAKHTKYSM